MSAAVLQGVPVVTHDVDLWMDLPSRQYMTPVNLAIRQGAIMVRNTVVELTDGMPELDLNNCYAQRVFRNRPASLTIPNQIAAHQTVKVIRSMTSFSPNGSPSDLFNWSSVEELYTKPHMPRAGVKIKNIRHPSVRSPNRTAFNIRFTVSWLPDMDLNHDKQIQSLLCYRYTIGHAGQCRRLTAL